MVAVELPIEVVRGGGRPSTYKNAAGKRIVGVTTITGRFDNKEALIGWAHKEGKEGRDYAVTRDQAAATGTAVHDAIEAFVTYGAVTDPEFLDLETEEQRHQAVLAYRSFLQWHAEVSPVITHAEMPIVNERLQVAGTIDAIGYLNGLRTLYDWKTSNGIYAGHVVQVGGYGTIWNEKHPDDLIEQYAVCRFGKDGQRHAHVWAADEMQPARDCFEQWTAAYRIDAEVQKLLRKRRQSEKETVEHVQES